MKEGDFWEHVDDFYERYPKIREAERTGECYQGLEVFLAQLLEDVEAARR
jgi:hypothetical protein